jgi:hypothetical protein
MKRILQTFTNQEFKKLKTVKGKKTWHDFILELADNRTNSFLSKEECQAG